MELYQNAVTGRKEKSLMPFSDMRLMIRKEDDAEMNSPCAREKEILEVTAEGKNRRDSDDFNNFIEYGQFPPEKQTCRKKNFITNRSAVARYMATLILALI